MTSTETVFQYGYATVAILGAQRVFEASPWAEIVQLLLEEGLFVDSADILGNTALHHASSSPSSARTVLLARLLTCHGADVNAQNCFGEVCTIGAMQMENLEMLDIFLFYGANIDVEDVDGWSPRRLFVHCAPGVISMTRKWIRRRMGIYAPYGEKRCDCCGKPKSPVKRRMSTLKLCSRCKLVRYCSVQCQVTSWAVHGKTCRPFTAANAVVLTPFYESDRGPESDIAFSCVPYDLCFGPKTVIVKVRIPRDKWHAPRTGSDLVVVSRSRSLVCRVRRYDDPREYDRLVAAIQSIGVEGLDAFFIAELQHSSCLVIRISDPLAEQPW
ncbi:hypothetical protein B0H16DRAFT_1432303 [Mycena metata]|uniref:MYND-type domain-containing protein n=1 Tax=Mycena metata TaxID=1033252 RepID=A0AAD7HI56_9AGAR|nr:hypothetical protein B0H16DRAFT_1432303 [Mycena metata]